MRPFLQDTILNRFTDPDFIANMRGFGLTLFIATLGGWAGTLAGLPVAWLCGSLLATALAALAGVNLYFPDILRSPLFVLLGAIMGAGVTPDTIAALGKWPLSFLGLAVAVFLMIGSVYATLRVLGKWDHETAFFSSLPGALSYVLVIAADSRANMAHVTISQTLRVFILVALVPMLVGSNAEETLIRSVLQANEMVFVLVVAAISGCVFSLLKFPGGWIVGALAGSAGLYVSGTVVGVAPQTVQNLCYLVLGGMIGSRFSGMDMAVLKRVLAMSLMAFVVGTVVSAGCSWVISGLLDLPFSQVFLAYAPGGLEAMVILSFLLDLDPAYVAGHHIARWIGLVVVLPVLSRMLIKSSPKNNI